MLKIVYANDIAQAPATEFDKFAENAEELLFPSSELASDRIKEEQEEWQKIKGLPVHLRYRDFVVSTIGKASFQPQQHVYLPGNSVIQILKVDGKMDVGVEKYRVVGPDGKFIDTREASRTNEEFVMHQANAYSLLIGNSNSVFLNDPERNTYSKGGEYYFWTLNANDGGRCMVAFNSDSDVNQGMFSAIIRVWKPADFKAFYGSLFRT